MKKQLTTLLLVFMACTWSANAQDEPDEYLEFNDRKNVVHGVYLGLSFRAGEIKGKDTYMSGLKVAYVANRQFEVGFEVVGFYSEQNLIIANEPSIEDIIGGYGGLHLEPILFSKSRVNLSFPVLIGAGVMGYIDSDFDYDNGEPDPKIKESDAIFILEPGINMLYNVSRYIQIEAGIRYRFSSKIDLTPSALSRINGFSAGIGIKVGVFNMGRNQYKKNL